MSPRPNTRQAPWAALLLAAVGCAQPGPILSRSPAVGSLKASVSQLESDKDRLQKQVARLEAENRKVEGQRSQAEVENGELAAKLDDARALLHGEGPITAGRGGSEADEPPPRRTSPATQGSGRRKPPLTQLPSPIRAPVPPRGDAEDDFFRPKARIGSRPRDEADGEPTARLDDAASWISVTRGASASRAR